MKLRANKKLSLIILPLVLAAGSFIFAPSARADWAADILTGLLSIIISALGLILVLVIQGLILIASYQHFIDSQAVILGWVIVRDVCNMFFVVILMVIAFGTILNIPDYSYKKWLPKLILFAVLINFSKTICGLLIDVTQVVMLTFVNAFKDIGGANMTQMLGITEIVTLEEGGGDPDFWTIVGAYVLGLIYLLVAIVVLVTMAMILAMRLVMIWIYVVLSPAAYLLSAVPGGQKYASQWWDEFIKNLIVGPVLAFFIWLSLAALTADTNIANLGKDANISGELSAIGSGYSLEDNESKGELPTKAGQPGALIKFFIGIGMLVGGLMVSQQIGGVAGSMAGKGMSALQKGKSLAVGASLGAALLPVKGAWKGTKELASYGTDKLHQASGIDFNLKRAWGVVQGKRKEIREKRYAEGQIAAGRVMEEGGRIHGILAMTGNPGDAWEQSTSLRGIGKRLKGGKKMRENLAKAQGDKRQADKDLIGLEFEKDWIKSTPEKRAEIKAKVEGDRSHTARKISEERNKIVDIDNQLKSEEFKGPEFKDEEKIASLQKERDVRQNNINKLRKMGEALQEKRRFFEEKDENGDLKNDVNKVYTNTEKRNIEQKISAKKQDVEKIEGRAENNIPEYNFEARSAEQHVVSQEMSKIKDITDPSELLRILKDAINSRDRTLVKAVTLKMTKDANDNEFLRPLAGRTDHIGLKDLMRQFSTEGHKNYAGFSEQEAYGLGSQIAELNKSTRHWAATSSYAMENGRWRETTNEEHNNIRDIESGKEQLQSFIRNNNRLAYGYHDVQGDFHLDAGGIIKLKSIDNADGHDNMRTMNESAALHAYQAIMKDEKLKSEFSKPTGKEGKTLLDALKQRLGHLAEKGKFDEKYKGALDLLASE